MRTPFVVLCFLIYCLGTLAFATVPSITSITPSSGPIGQKVTLHGSNYLGATGVAFNGTQAATYTVVSAYYITAIVPNGATSGPITVTTPGRMVTSTTDFTVLTPPTITGIADQTINMGTSTTALQFTVGDDLTPPALLTVTGGASNTALIKPAGIVFTGPDSNGNCSVTVTPVATYSGMTTITLTVTDDAGLTAKTSFTLTVNRPTITPIANQMINMGTSTSALAFTVEDDLTPLASLTVTGVSSNMALIHAGGIVLTGPDSSGLCSVTVTPVATYSGITLITLMVTDGGGLTAKTSFILTVNRPTITAIANQTINMGASTSALAFTVGDNLTPLASLTVAGVSSNTALIHASGIVLTGPNASGVCSVTLTPVATYNGVTTIKLTVTDGAGLTATTSFIVTVGVVNNNFATPVTSSYLYNPTGGTWTFTGYSGIQHNGSAWGAAASPSGTQTAFLQPSGVISQSVFLPPGNYQVVFDAAQRIGNDNPPMSIEVLVDGVQVGSDITPSGASFASYSSAAFTITTSGSHTLVFANSDGTASDFYGGNGFICLITIRQVISL